MKLNDKCYEVSKFEIYVWFDGDCVVVKILGFGRGIVFIYLLLLYSVFSIERNIICMWCL